MRVFAFKHKRNVGDSLTIPVLRHFLPETSLRIVHEDERGKLVGIGSILNNVRAGDTVWGTGAMFPHETVRSAGSINFLAVRGKLTEEIVRQSGGQCSGITGDPGLLLPLIYRPTVETKFEVGVIPHFIDYAAVGRDFGWNTNRTLIDPFLPWKEFVDKVLACRRIISSSLHGIVIAEAYGVPAEWREFSNKVRGSGFKFRDYLTGTGRAIQAPGNFPPIKDLTEIQHHLVFSLGAIS